MIPMNTYFSLYNFKYLIVYILSNTFAKLYFNILKHEIDYLHHFIHVNYLFSRVLTAVETLIRNTNQIGL